jgi:hypothetical protein
MSNKCFVARVSFVVAPSGELCKSENNCVQIITGVCFPPTKESLMEYRRIMYFEECHRYYILSDWLIFHTSTTHQYDSELSIRILHTNNSLA